MRKPSSSAGELRFIPPLRPILQDAPPEGEGWIHEVKFDGYRTQLVIDRGRIRLFTMNGHDWTEKYWPIALAAEQLPCWSAIIDGEVIVGDGRVADFDAMQRAIGRDAGKLSFIAFDLLHHDGCDMRGKPLLERKADLKALLSGAPPKIQNSKHFETDGATFLKSCDAMGLEGIISKRAASKYRSGESADWLKVKCFAEEQLEVIGVTAPRPGEPAMALVADPERRRVGRAFVTLDTATRERFWTSIEKMKAKGPPPGVKPRRDAQWIRPGLTGRVQFLKGAGELRHASLKGVQEKEPPHS